MKKTSFFTSLPFKLLVSVIVGIIAGLILSSTDSYSITMGILNVVVTLKYILLNRSSDLESSTDQLLCTTDHHWIYCTFHH